METKKQEKEERYNMVNCRSPLHLLQALAGLLLNDLSARFWYTPLTMRQNQIFSSTIRSIKLETLKIMQEDGPVKLSVLASSLGL